MMERQATGPLDGRDSLCRRKWLASQCAPGRGMVAVDPVWGGEGLMSAAVGTAV